MKLKNMPKPAQAAIYKTNYDNWKAKQYSDEVGFYPIYETFSSKLNLCKISGNALKLYIFLGLVSDSITGESWYSIDSIAKYFDKSPRTINNWFKELKDLGLIDKIQFDYDKEAHTFLKPY